MTELHASVGITIVLTLWALWLWLDPRLRPENLSWTHLILWLLSPLAMYVVLARHSHPPDPPAFPVGKEGIIAQMSPLEVEVFGSFWPARCRDSRALRLGQRVRVVQREGLSLLVEPLA